MKSYLTILILLTSATLFAQTNDLTVYGQDELDQKAYFNSEDSSFNKYFFTKFSFPEQAIEDGVFGKVIITFNVEKNGAVSAVYCISEPLEYGIEDLAIKTIKESSGFWQPGLKNNSKVRSKMLFDFELKTEDEISSNNPSKRKRKKYKPKGRARWHYQKKIRAQKKDYRQQKRKKKRKDRLIKKGKMTITPEF